MTERKQEFHGYQLAIADITTGQINHYSISSYVTLPTMPVWSEDEAFLAISVNVTDDDFYSYIFSLTDNKTYPLPENAIPYGWVMIP
jgi:hypothetical protein